MLRHIDYYYRDEVYGGTDYVKREYVPANHEVAFEHGRYLGFSTKELIDLRRALSIADITIDEGISRILRVDRAKRLQQQQEREWREHFGILCDLFAPEGLTVEKLLAAKEEIEDDTPYVKCMTCGFKVVTEHHMMDATMRCTPKGHEVFFGREYFIR